MENFTERKAPAGLYDPRFEHDNCGIGAVVDIKGRKSHKTIDDALQIVERLEHRAGKDAAGETGDGVGMMTQVPHMLLPGGLPRRALTWAATGTTASACSSSRRRAAPEPGQENAGDHLRKKRRCPSGLAGGAHPSGRAGPQGPGLYALHLPVLCGPACRLRPWPGL